MEPILTPSLQRFALFPIQYSKAFELYTKHIAAFWTVGEIDLATDKNDFDQLPDPERRFIMKVLAFFANADGIVNENIAARFSEEIQIPEIRMFYGFQQGMETIHQHMYNLLIETYEDDSDRKLELFRSIETDASISKKAQWAMRWLGSDAPFAHRLVAFVAVEGIFFSASFCAIFYFKKRGKLPGLTFSNELISRDEALHTEFGCHVYSLLQTKLATETVHNILRSAVDAEREFVCDALESDLIGMNATTMVEYVEFVADYIVTMLGHPKIYNTINPYPWMTLISLPGKTNFFEKRVSEYQKAGVMEMLTTDRNNTFSSNVDF